MSSQRRLSLILAAMLLCTCGCGSTTSSDNPTDLDTSSEITGTGTETETSGGIVPPDIEAVDCGGAEYSILCKSPGGYTFPYSEFLAEEQNGETMNDAIYHRNIAIEEKYNLKLTAIEDSNVRGKAKSSILAGDSSFDLVMPMTAEAFAMTLEGLLCDISLIPYVSIESPWWHAGISNNTSIGGRNYFISGDLNLSMLNGVGVTYFNKELASKYNIGDIYQTVRDGKWTLDRFSEYCKGITQDLNGDTVLNGDDMFGLTCNAFVWQPLFSGTASRIIEKDDDDIPYLAWDNERNIAVIEKLISLLNDRDSTILVNQFPVLQDSGGWGNASIKMFTEDRALFWIEIIYGVLQLRDMNTDFGLLPMPKYDESQPEYTSYIHANWTSTCCVPVTADNLDLTGRILEDMAYQSYLTVRPAYYEITLKGKVSRDNESGEMLDIIYSNINLDLTLAMSLSGLPIDTTMRSAMIDNRTDLSSMIASQKSACEEIIKKNTDTILKLD